METIGVIGLGYVGLPLAVEFGKKQKTIGFDINEARVQELREGKDHTLEMSAEDLQQSKHLVLANTIEELQECTCFIITVPTPVDERNQPVLTPLQNASQLVGGILKKGDLVIYESTVYPGVTEDICVPVLEAESGLIFNADFHCGYSPERINPGDKERTLTKILKITSGSTPGAAERVDALYNSIITAGTYRAPSIKVAEAAKVIENTQRDIAIATVNELALIFETMGINTREVIEAAATKWNFVKLYPGLVGGHCIGVDPYYLAFKANENGYTPNLLLSARQINNGMAKFIAEKTVKTMIAADKKIKNAKVLILGVTFKENCPDLRNTKVLDIAEHMQNYGCQVSIWDPWVNVTQKDAVPGLLEADPFVHSTVSSSVDSSADSAANASANSSAGSSATASAGQWDAFVVAVGHRQFVGLSREQFEQYSNGELVLTDVKGLYDFATWQL